MPVMDTALSHSADTGDIRNRSKVDTRPGSHRATPSERRVWKAKEAEDARLNSADPDSVSLSLAQEEVGQRDTPKVSNSDPEIRGERAPVAAEWPGLTSNLSLSVSLSLSIFLSLSLSYSLDVSRKLAEIQEHFHSTISLLGKRIVRPHDP